MIYLAVGYPLAISQGESTSYICVIMDFRRHYLIGLDHHSWLHILLSEKLSDCPTGSIYVFAERPDNLKLSSSDKPRIYSIGPNITAHRRHFLQQAAYTVCVQFDRQKHWQFASHESVFTREDRGVDFRQDVLWKITIPKSERVKVLKSLNEYNLNAFSLFGSEESLMEMLGIENFDFDADDIQQN